MRGVIKCILQGRGSSDFGLIILGLLAADRLVLTCLDPDVPFWLANRRSHILPNFSSWNALTFFLLLLTTYLKMHSRSLFFFGLATAALGSSCSHVTSCGTSSTPRVEG